MILAFVVLTQCERVTDRRTDGLTDNSTVANTGLCIASYANALYNNRSSSTDLCVTKHSMKTSVRRQTGKMRNTAESDWLPRCNTRVIGLHFHR